MSNLTADSLEQKAAMLPTDPPPLIARGMATLLIACFVILILAAVLVKIPETVRCPFVLAPKDGDDPVQAPFHAVVQAVRVSEGQEVKAGADLFVLRSDELRSRETHLRTLEEDERAQKETSSNLEAAYQAQLAIKDAEMAQTQREIEFLQQHVAASRDLVSRFKKLQALGGMAEVELARAQLDLAESEKNLNVTQKAIETIRFERQRLDMDRARQRDDEKSSSVKTTLEISATKESLNGAGEGQLTVRAPYDSVVLSIEQRNVGNVVESGSELCHLARPDAAPRAHLVVVEQGLPRLAPGQRVRLFFEAFPYQRYGAVPGKLEWISPASVAAEGTRNFTAEASLERRDISVGGQLRPLRVGMRGEARVIVGSRTPLEFAFEPVRQLEENLRR